MAFLCPAYFTVHAVHQLCPFRSNRVSFFCRTEFPLCVHILFALMMDTLPESVFWLL